MSNRYYYAAYVDGACSHQGTDLAAAAASAELLAFHAIGRQMVKSKTFVWAVEGAQNAQRAELAAVVYTLEQLTFACAITIHTDSAYVIHWSDKQRRQPNKKNSKLAAKDADLWERLDRLAALHKVSLQWCKGHGRTKVHNRVDKLARKEARRLYFQQSGGEQ